MGAHGGTVYTVCGCSGAGGEGEGTIGVHPVMAVTRGGYGSMVVEVNGLQLTAKFLRSTSVVGDYFTIDKSADTTNCPPLGIARDTNGVVISWPTSKPAFTLHRVPTIPNAVTNWHPVSTPPQMSGRRNVVTVPRVGEAGFFQLRKEP
jgi:hypothetical protein